MTKTSPTLGNSAAANGLEPVDSVLLRAAKEACLLHADLAQLEREISQAVTTIWTSEVNGLQRVDSARQALEGLSLFLFRLAATVDEVGNCDPVDAASTLTLQAQAQRLATVSCNLLRSTGPEPEIW